MVLLVKKNLKEFKLNYHLLVPMAYIISFIIWVIITSTTNPYSSGATIATLWFIFLVPSLALLFFLVYLPSRWLLVKLEVIKSNSINLTAINQSFLRLAITISVLLALKSLKTLDIVDLSLFAFAYIILRVYLILSRSQRKISRDLKKLKQ